MSNVEPWNLTELTSPTGTERFHVQGADPDDWYVTLNTAAAHAQVGMATDAELSAHASDTTSVHGIADTSALLDTSDIGTTVQAYDADLADIAGLADVQGDILVRGATGWERLAKSATSTDVLTAGASQPTWAAASSSGVGYTDAPGDSAMARSSNGISGQGYHYPAGMSGVSSASSSQAQMAGWVPFWLPKACTPTLFIYCWTAQAGATARFSVWSNDGDNFKPSTLLEDVGTVSGATAGNKEVTGAVSVGPGWVWVGVWASNHSSVRWSRGSSGRGPMGDSANANGRSVWGYSASALDYSSAWSSTLPTLAAFDNVVNAQTPPAGLRW